MSLSCDITSTLFVVFDLRFKDYYFRVRGHNAHGWGYFSSRSDAAHLDRRF